MANADNSAPLQNEPTASGWFGCGLQFTATWVLAIGLTFIFWRPLWSGAGFVGGDVYSYFFPQKVIYGEALQAGQLPLWNARAGFGYPLLGESQTGVFYPFNLALYRAFNAHTAYHVSFLLHYVLAFVFSAAAARRFGVSLVPAWLTALVYVYGWFPPRSCVEWAIVGGTWLPAALWCAESFLATRWWRYAIGLSAVLAVQLLAGHFQIAWFTLLLLSVYVPARLWWFRGEGSGVGGQGSGEEPAATGESIQPSTRRTALVAFAAMFCGLSLAAVQLAPTYELKQRSQRVTVGKDHELNFGSIPPWYWTQVFRPSHWYSPLTNREAAFGESPPLGHARTNSAEAHLYFGLVPLLLAVTSLMGAARSQTARQPIAFWGIMAVASGIYTSGWFLPLTQHLPGFSYFQGPGRYGLLTTWAIALLAGMAVDRFLREPHVSRCLALVLLGGAVWSLTSWFLLSDDVAAVMADFHISNPWAWPPENARDEGPLTSLLQVNLLMLVVLAISLGLWWLSQRPRAWDVRIAVIGAVCLTTAVEFWAVSRLVTFTQMVSSPPLAWLDQSPVRRLLLDTAESMPMLRLFAPGPNLPSTLGVSCAPTYLTFGPAEYVDQRLMLPLGSAEAKMIPANREQLDWLRRSGVTHVLSFEPSPNELAGLELIWMGDDPFLNRAWGRSGQSLFVYQIENALGRVQWQPAGEEQTLRLDVREVAHTANQLSFSADVAEPGRLVLADLDFPGWSVTIDGQAAPIQRTAGLFRGVDLLAGPHHIVWTYQPRSVWAGGIISFATLLFLAAVAHVRFWHPQRLSSCDATLSSPSA